MELDGSAGDVDLNFSGASRATLPDFLIDNADVNFSGASSGTVNVSDSLDVLLSGASRLSYIGEPTFDNIDISGTSTITKE